MLFGHVVDVLEVLRASSSDVLESWDFTDLHFGWLLALSPEVEVVDVLLQGLAVLGRWALAFPAFLLQVFAFGQVKCSLEAVVEVLDNAEVLFLDS